MYRSNLFIIATCILVLSAGVVVGRLWATLPVVKREAGDHQPSWLADQLNLSSQQQQQIDAIWKDVKQKLDKGGERRAELDKQREQAVLALLTPDQQKSYEKIIADFRAQRAEMEKDRHDLIAQADQRSEALLDGEQKARWEKMRPNGGGWHGPHGNGHGGMGGPPPGHGPGHPPGPPPSDEGAPPPPPSTGP